MKRKATIEEVAAEFAKGAITEVDLREPFYHLDGYCDYGSRRVYVNPKPALVETLLHELCHRRWPRWGERRVTEEARRLLCHMSDAEVARWYRSYQRIARRRRSPKRIED